MSDAESALARRRACFELLSRELAKLDDVNDILAVMQTLASCVVRSMAPLTPLGEIELAGHIFSRVTFTLSDTRPDNATLH